MMPIRDPVKQAEASKRWYEANKATVAAKKNRKRERLKQMIREAKAVPCADCGETYPHYVMDFDHLGEKDVIVSRLVAHGSVRKLEEEIAKCEVVCSNCHRERTHQRGYHGM